MQSSRLSPMMLGSSLVSQLEKSSEGERSWIEVCIGDCSKCAIRASLLEGLKSSVFQSEQ